MTVTDLNHTVRHLCHVVGNFFELPNIFHDYFLLTNTDQWIEGNTFCCFDRKPTETEFSLTA